MATQNKFQANSEVFAALAKVQEGRLAVLAQAATDLPKNTGWVVWRDRAAKKLATMRATAAKYAESENKTKVPAELRQKLAGATPEQLKQIEALLGK